jgi:hypothetical protein
MERKNSGCRHRPAPPGVLLFAPLLWAAGVASAHHTYSMYDQTRHLSVSGTVAKFEWRNPHAFIWLYVPSQATPGKYDLFALENGSPTVLAKEGWNKDILRAGDRITVEYSPLRDGKPGGHCVKVTLADGRTLGCAGPALPPRPPVVDP